MTTYDATNLRRLRGVNAGAGADLNQGFGTFRDRDRREIYPAPVHVIFGAIEASGQTKVLEDVDVITWRGNVSKLLTTAWNVSEAWTMEAELVNNRTIVLNVKETEEGLRKALTRDGRDERMCYWGYAFEEAACSEKPFEEPVDCMECFCCVVKTKMGDLNVLMAGEVDCFEGDAELANYVELKTSRVMNDERQVKRFEKEKLLKWWAQSFALGVRRIMVGFRDDHGRVVKTQMLETLKLPGYVVKHANSWTPKDALRCASAVLTKLKELLADEPSGTRVRVEYEPKKAKHRVNFIRDDSIPDFLPADARRETHERRVLARERTAAYREANFRFGAAARCASARTFGNCVRDEHSGANRGQNEQNRVHPLARTGGAFVHARQRPSKNVARTRGRRHDGWYRHRPFDLDTTKSQLHRYRRPNEPTDDEL